jgi:hypothetical protein
MVVGESLLGRVVAVAAVFASASCAAGVAPAAALPTHFGEEGSSAGQFLVPAGVAVEQESGDVFLADRNNNRIDKFGPEGEFLLAWGWAVADGTTKALQTCATTCFGGTGSPFEGAGTGQFTSVEGIAVNNDSLSVSHGDVYIVDAGNNRVQKFGHEGKFLLMFGGEVNATTKGNVCKAGEACKGGVPGKGAGSFEGLRGRSIAVDAAGTVYVGDENRVQLFTEGGVVKGEVALPGAGAVENLAVDSAKDIYAMSSALAGVRKYEGAGKELGPPRNEAGQGEAMMIAIGPSDELFVNDLREGRHHILTFNAAGEQSASFDAAGQVEGGERGIAYSEKLKALYALNPGAVRIITPPPPGPLILLGSESASEVQPTTAILNAVVNPEEKASAEGELKYHFEYGETASYGTSTAPEPSTGASFEDRPVTASLTKLLPGTTYHFRVVAENVAKEVTNGPDQTFTTLPPVSIDGTSASQVNATSARLEAELNPHGLPTEYHFEYGTSASYGTSVPVPDGNVGAGTVDVTRSVLVQGLVPSTAYHYRVVALNSLGTVESPDRSFVTQSAASALPDGRAWELVSPPNKHGAPLEAITEESGVIQAAAGGGSITYVALGPVSSEAAGARAFNNQLLSHRGSGGWATQEIATPHEEASIVHAGHPSEYKLFSEDLSAGIVEPEGATPLSSHTSERTPYRREADGEYVPLITPANVPPGVKFGGHEATLGQGLWTNGVVFLTATPDLSHVVLDSPQVLAPGFAPGFVPNPNNHSLYELSGGVLRLISVLPSGEPTSEAGLKAGVGNNELNMRGAVSSDGGRVVFEAGGEHLYVRDVGLSQTLQLDERQPGAAGGTGVAVFQGASSDAGKIFFTDESRLTTDATAMPARPDLYMCEVVVVAGHLSCALSDLTVDANAGEAADVQGMVAAVDAAGRHVFFAANGVLTNTPNGRGERAVPGSCASEQEASCNLYASDTSSRRVSLVAVLSSKDSPDWAVGAAVRKLGGLTARVSPNGRYFTFMSRRSLTGYDNRDVRSGQRDEEVFLFDAVAGVLRCVSCNPTGARPLGVFDKEQFPGLLVDRPRSWKGRWLAGSIPGWTLALSNEQALYQSRYLSNSGRMVFNAADALVPQDTNGVEDVYEYEPPGVGSCTESSPTFSPASGGCVSLISSGESKEESAFLDASANGDEVFFLTASRLTSADVDSAFDVYDAHVCSAASPCPPPPPPPSPACQGDACQSSVGAPTDATPGSLTYRGPGNAVQAGARPLTRVQLLARALKACKRDKPGRKRAACEKRARGRYGAKKAQAKRAGRGRRSR